MNLFSSIVSALGTFLGNVHAAGQVTNTPTPISSGAGKSPPSTLQDAEDVAAGGIEEAGEIALNYGLSLLGPLGMLAEGAADSLYLSIAQKAAAKIGLVVIPLEEANIKTTPPPPAPAALEPQAPPEAPKVQVTAETPPAPPPAGAATLDPRTLPFD
jgi:hypothetical protein